VVFLETITKHDIHIRNSYVLDRDKVKINGVYCMVQCAVFGRHWDKVLERSHSNALIDMVRSKVLCPRTPSPLLSLLRLVFSCRCCMEFEAAAMAGGDSEREIENSLVSMNPLVFLFLASAVVGDKLSCSSGGVPSSTSTGDGRLKRHGSSSAGVEEAALGSTCFCC